MSQPPTRRSVVGVVLERLGDRELGRQALPEPRTAWQAFCVAFLLFRVEDIASGLNLALPR